jgi:predicted nucleic acid-binding protein
VVSLARKGVFEIALRLEDHLPEVEALLRKYADQPASLADAALIRCADVYGEGRIATFDGDFEVYRWSRNRRFEIIGG